MKTDIQKQFRSIRWLTEHTLSEDQRKKLVEAKLERARLEHLALKKREELYKSH